MYFLVIQAAGVGTNPAPKSTFILICSLSEFLTSQRVQGYKRLYDASCSFRDRKCNIRILGNLYPWTGIDLDLLMCNVDVPWTCQHAGQKAADQAIPHASITFLCSGPALHKLMQLQRDHTFRGMLSEYGKLIHQKAPT